jgi:hypothetical protein
MLSGYKTTAASKLPLVSVAIVAQQYARLEVEGQPFLERPSAGKWLWYLLARWPNGPRIKS